MHANQYISERFRHSQSRFKAQRSIISRRECSVLISQLRDRLMNYRLNWVTACNLKTAVRMRDSDGRKLGFQFIRPRLGAPHSGKKQLSCPHERNYSYCSTIGGVDTIF